MDCNQMVPLDQTEGVFWRAVDRGNRDRKKKGEKSPRCNLPHCGNKPDHAINLHFSFLLENNIY